MVRGGTLMGDVFDAGRFRRIKVKLFKSYTFNTVSASSPILYLHDYMTFDLFPANNQTLE